MSTHPDLTHWYQVIAVVITYLPLMILAIPLIFQILGIMGMIWYIFAMLRFNSYRYYFSGLVKSLVVFLIGLVLQLILPPTWTSVS